ncbi:DUF1877 family protein [Escherichia coli]
MGVIGYFAEIDSENINQLLESTEKTFLMEYNMTRFQDYADLHIDKRWDFLHFGLQAPLL